MVECAYVNYCILSLVDGLNCCVYFSLGLSVLCCLESCIESCYCICSVVLICITLSCVNLNLKESLVKSLNVNELSDSCIEIECILCCRSRSCCINSKSGNGYKVDCERICILNYEITCERCVKSNFYCVVVVTVYTRRNACCVDSVSCGKLYCLIANSNLKIGAPTVLCGVDKLKCKLFNCNILHGQSSLLLLTLERTCGCCSVRIHYLIGNVCDIINDMLTIEVSICLAINTCENLISSDKMPWGMQGNSSVWLLP